MAEAKEEPLDIDQLAQDLDESRAGTEMLLEQLDRAGLVWLAPAEEPELSPLLTRAGSQYLELKGQVPHEVLFFLPAVIDDLYARKALIHGGTVLIDEFRYAVVHGEAVDHAAGLVPDAFEGAVDEPLAVNLFAAAVALMARLSSGEAAGCLAEEVMAVALLNQAAVWLDLEADRGEMEAEAVGPARDALRGIFELFEDDDVLNLFRMEEPADAAIAGHSPLNRQMGVVDQRLESWFYPFGGVPGTGYLDERTEESEDGEDE
jgi:hypothetical protein